MRQGKLQAPGNPVRELSPALVVAPVRESDAVKSWNVLQLRLSLTAPAGRAHSFAKPCSSRATVWSGTDVQAALSSAFIAHWECRPAKAGGSRYCNFRAVLELLQKFASTEIDNLAAQPSMGGVSAASESVGKDRQRKGKPVGGRDIHGIQVADLPCLYQQDLWECESFGRPELKAGSQQSQCSEQ